MSRHIRILRENELSDSERAVILEIRDQAFGLNPWGARFSWSLPDWRFLLEADGVLVSHLKLTLRAGLTGGRPCNMVGVGGVMTLPEHQGRGYASKLLDEAEPFMFRNLSADLGVLFCLESLVPFYADRGWLAVTSPVTVAQPQGNIDWPERAMVLPRPGSDWTDQPLDIQGLPW